MFININWDYYYSLLGVKDFIYFISAPGIQDQLFFVKVIFVLFSGFFLCAVVYFYLNSSYIQYQFLQDTTEFLSHQPFGLRKVNKSWKQIKKRIDTESESELKLAIIEADDFLYETLQDAGYSGDTFEELINNADKKTIGNLEELLEAHAMRNSIVYEPNYSLDIEKAKKILAVYEDTIKNTTLT